MRLLPPPPPQHLLLYLFARLPRNKAPAGEGMRSNLEHCIDLLNARSLPGPRAGHCWMACGPFRRSVESHKQSRRKNTKRRKKICSSFPFLKSNPSWLKIWRPTSQPSERRDAMRCDDAYTVQRTSEPAKRTFDEEKNPAALLGCLAARLVSTIKVFASRPKLSQKLKRTSRLARILTRSRQKSDS